MNLSKLREMSLEDLESEGQALSEQIFRLRFQKATGQLENRTKIRQIRRDLARVKTIVAERQQQRQ
ncbi:MAG: 50S ribosomal protein L29 [Candidatus Aminicenantes bacterium]|nr:50S ribosomal protein L29 [Candidatus Aminicenantes bacterium]